MASPIETSKPTPQELASRGFYLFPCKGKKPLVKWSKESTTDLSTIALWAERFPGCSWGVDCGKSGLFVLDDDRGKNPEAENSLLDLEMTHGSLPETFTVRTPSHGYHFYFVGSGRNSASSKLGAGLDTRGAGGYVVAPCSRGYSVCNEHPIVAAPEWLTRIVGKDRTREKASPDGGASATSDDPSATLRAKTYLKEVPPAIEGQGGNDHTYLVACRVRDFGISEPIALYLMDEHFNERCEPPWSPDELATIIANAYSYAENKNPGASLPQAVFTEFVDSAPTDKKRLFIDALELINQDLKINYLIQDLVETPSTGLMFGESGAGKSFIALAMALAVATGADWLGNMAAPGPVYYLAGEGQKGLPRRIKAWLEHYGATLAPGMLQVTRKRIELDPRGAKLVIEEINSMVAISGPPKLIIIDTLARHMPAGQDENSAKDVNVFVNAIDYLRDTFNCVVLVIHHSGKMNKDTSRGSSALKAAMDFEILVKPGVVQYTKQKDGETPAPFGFSLVDVQLGEGVSSAAPISCQYDPTGGKLARLSADAQLGYSVLQFEISQAGNGYIGEKGWRKAFFDALPEDMPEATKRQKFVRIKKKLLENEAISVDGERVYENSLSADAT